MYIIPYTYMTVHWKNPYFHLFPTFQAIFSHVDRLWALRVKQAKQTDVSASTTNHYHHHRRHHQLSSFLVFFMKPRNYLLQSTYLTYTRLLPILHSVLKQWSKQGNLVSMEEKRKDKDKKRRESIWHGHGLAQQNEYVYTFQRIIWHVMLLCSSWTFLVMP